MRLLKFYANWCGPCKLMTPIVKKFVELHKDYELNEIDVDQNPGLAQSYGISSIPAVVVIDNDNRVKKVVRGSMPLDKFEKEVL